MERTRIIERLVELGASPFTLDDVETQFNGIDFIDVAVTDEQLDVAAKLGQVDHVGFIRTKVTLRQFQTALALPGLHSFLWGNGSLEDPFVDALVKLKRLSFLSFRKPQLSLASRGRVLSWIKSLKDLETLSLNDCGISDAELSLLEPLAKLRKLELNDNPISFDGARQIGQLPNIRRLWLARTKIDDRGLGQIARLLKLEELWIEDCKVTVSGLSQLRGLTELADLYFAADLMDDSIVELLKGDERPFASLLVLGGPEVKAKLSKPAREELQRLEQERHDRRFVEYKSPNQYGWEPSHLATTHWAIGTATVDPECPAQLKLSPGTESLVNTDRGSDLRTRSGGSARESIYEFEVLLPQGSSSGIYLLSEYGIQVADSFGKPNLGVHDMGAICGVAPPRVNAAKPAGQWQRFEIRFKGSQYDMSSKKISDPTFVKVVLNGQVIHEDVALAGPTPGGLTSGRDLNMGDLVLKGNGGPVAYRNIKCTPIFGKRDADDAGRAPQN